MPREIEFEGKVHEFPDDATDDEIRRVLSGKVIYGPKQTPAAAPPQAAAPSLGQRALEASESIDEGIKKGARSLVYHGGDIIRRMTGGPRIIDTPEVQQLTQPKGPWEDLGYGAEKVLEFLMPGSLVSKGEQTLAQLAGTGRAAPVINLLGRTGLEAGSAAGVAGLQTGGDPEAMLQAGATAGAVTGGLGVAGAAAGPVANWLKRSASTQYGKVLNPTMKSTKHIARHETIPGMLERRVQAGTMQGLLDRTQKQVDKWGKAIENAWNKIPQNTPLEIAPMLQAIDDSVAHASVGGVNLGPVADVIVDHAARFKKLFTDLAKPKPQTGVLEITVGDLRKVREFADKIAADAGAFAGKDLAEQSLAAIHETTGNVARAQIAPRFPEVAKANEQFHWWKDAHKVVDETVERRVGQERGLLKTIGNTIGGTAGTAIGGQIGGPVGAVVGSAAGAGVTEILQRLATSPGWRTVSAVNKQRFAEFLASGNVAAAELWLRKIASSMGATAATLSRSQPPAQRPAEAR